MLVQTWGLVFALLVASTVSACPVEPHEFMLAEMRGFGSEPGVNESGMTEEVFNETLGKVIDQYEKVFTDQGISVQRIIDWNNTWVNAQTGWTGARSIKFLFSGELARQKYMTRDALVYVACHEVGHHLGGFPKKDGKWSTSEGGADYFAALKCMRTIFKNDPENALSESAELPDEVKAKCREVYADQDDYLLCLRTTKAGDDMARTFKYRRVNTEVPMLMLSVLPEVEKTNDAGYPSNECRAVTAFAGAVCSKGPDFPISYVNEASGYCHENNGDTFGMRPRCWFKPNITALE